MSRGIASQFIELKKDAWVTLPPHADCLVLVVKSGGFSGTSNYVIDLKNSHDPAIAYGDMATLAWSNFTNSSSSKYLVGTFTGEDARLQCFGYDLDSGTDPDWVRIYYRTNR